MWTKLNPKMLWGRPVQFDNYKRVDIQLKKGLTQGIVKKELANFEASTKRLSYANGLFYVFKTKAKHLEFKYKYHHSNKHDFYLARQAIVEPQLCGKSKETEKWILLNRMHINDQYFPGGAEKEYTIKYTFTEDFSEFQFCLPFGSVFYYIETLSESKIELIKPAEVKFGFLGSSIGSFIGTYACCLIPSQLYRELGINSCNLSIPMTNSAIYDDVLCFVKSKQDIKWYLIDTMHMTLEGFNRLKNFNIKTACINARVVANYKFPNTNYIFEFDNPIYHRDHLHLTSAGAYAFILSLIPLLKEDLQNEKLSNN